MSDEKQPYQFDKLQDYENKQRNENLTEVIDQRVQVYGNPVETFARIAEVWSGILGVTVNATDVPLCLMGMKMVRATQAPDYSDNPDDIEGYLDIFRQLVGEDMIHARSVTEYIAKKWPANAEYTVAQANADQSRFYAENDRTKDAGPDEDEIPPVLTTDHEFFAADGDTGMVCTAMVMRDGGGDQCGLPARAHVRRLHMGPYSKDHR